MRTKIMMSTLVLCLMASSSHATGWKFGAHIGGLTINDAKNNQILLGGHIEIPAQSYLGIRGDVSYRSEEEFSFRSEEVGQLSMTSTTLPITVSANVYLPVPLFKPYAIAGVGWYIHDFKFSQDFLNIGEKNHHETDFGWHVGVGATWSLAPKVVLFGEYRALFFGDDKNFDTINQAVGDLDFSSHQVTVGASLILN